MFMGISLFSYKGARWVKNPSVLINQKIHRFCRKCWKNGLLQDFLYVEVKMKIWEPKVFD